MRLFLLLLLSFPIVAFAATTITGTWNVKLDYEGQGGSATFVLKQDGDKLTGEYSGPHGDADVTGTISGHNVELQFETSTAQIFYHGRINSAGDKMNGTYDYSGQSAGSFVATKAANP
jgi:hypothetical protein